MKYVVRPASSGNGRMSVIASDACEAVQLALDRGIPAVEVLDEHEVPCDLAGLARLADGASASVQHG